jgi:hypothetical protein
VILNALLLEGQTAEIHWVKGHIGVLGMERADQLAGKATEKQRSSREASLTHLKLRISEKFRAAKDAWHKDPNQHGSEEIPPPPPKKSCMGRAKNGIDRTAAQLRTGHWRSAVYLKRIKKRRGDECWFCSGKNRMTLHCSNGRISAAREEVWEKKDPGSVRSSWPIPGGIEGSSDS